MGLGDAVEAATKAAGVKPCGGCLKAKALMNSRDPRKVVQGLAMIPGNALAIARGEAKEAAMPIEKWVQEKASYFLGIYDITEEYIFKKYPNALSEEQKKEIRDYVQKLKDGIK